MKRSTGCEAAAYYCRCISFYFDVLIVKILQWSYHQPRHLRYINLIRDELYIAEPASTSNEVEQEKASCFAPVLTQGSDMC
jgi:hypothetical protein